MSFLFEIGTILSLARAHPAYKVSLFTLLDTKNNNSQLFPCLMIICPLVSFGGQINKQLNRILVGFRETDKPNFMQTHHEVNL